MGDKTRGLFHKFNIERTDGTSGPGGKHDGCDYFVLDLTHDKHAPAAIRAYAGSCREEYPLLAADLDAKFPSSPLPSDKLMRLVRKWRHTFETVTAHGNKLWDYKTCADELEEALGASVSQEPSSGEAQPSFWVIEKFVDGKSIGYWDGGHSEHFVTDIEKAIQFRRKDDAFWFNRAWGPAQRIGVQLTEHLMLFASPVTDGEK